ncbi:MAG: bifunctional 5,10-methylenetetrahydrofolate dehydrogenase/5,10-methenyltetrahydrofolate cyclohydrolase [Blautia sp.]|nr:bifunctional 5,10-methylenetetrahydrofolate dehydrogenase/5,10-methenyltetrahydrofolate cyclohydrolase [Blautia sp.]
MARLLTGKEVSASIAERVRADVSFLMEKGITPTLATVRVGNDPGDAAYERGAAKRCEALGVCCRKIVLDENVSQEELISVLESLNKDQSVHGVLLFRPLPKRFDQALIENTLVPEKDIDCMTDLSMSGVYTGRDIGYPPCTAEACMEILDHYGIDCTGKKAVVIGRSLVIGKPAAMMLLKKNATVTVCHTRTKDMASVTRDADILIAAAGRAGIVDGSYVREGQTVIDVGINVDAEGKICGDVDEESVSPVDLALTPVPGGVGTVTTAVLVKHVVEAAKKTVLL